MDDPNEEIPRELIYDLMGYNSRNTPLPSSFSEMMDETEALIKKGRLRTALDQIIPLLDCNPNDEWAFELATYVFYNYQLYDNRFYAPERLTDEYLYDLRFDKIFCECNRCRRFWVLNPIMRSRLRVMDLNPIGGQCPKCNKIFCFANCATDNYCPDCRIKLETITEPNGRTPRQAPRRKEKIELVIIFREGPVLPDDEYLTKLLQRHSPDVLKENPPIKTIARFPWPNANHLGHEIAAISSQIRGKRPNSDFVEGFYGSDNEGNQFCLMKFYKELKS